MPHAIGFSSMTFQEKNKDHRQPSASARLPAAAVRAALHISREIKGIGARVRHGEECRTIRHLISCPIPGEGVLQTPLPFGGGRFATLTLFSYRFFHKLLYPGLITQGGDCIINQIAPALSRCRFHLIQPIIIFFRKPEGGMASGREFSFRTWHGSSLRRPHFAIVLDGMISQLARGRLSESVNQWDRRRRRG